MLAFGRQTSSTELEPGVTAIPGLTVLIVALLLGLDAPLLDLAGTVGLVVAVLNGKLG